MFYACLGLLASRTLGTSKDTGALSLFNQHFVKNGLFSHDVARHFRQADLVITRISESGGFSF